MVSQPLNKLFCLYNLVSFRISPTLSTGRAPRAASADYGFDFDGTELENEFFAQNIKGLSSRFIQPVEANEFEMRYRWFIS